MIEEKEMSFLDHLEVLRWHLVRAFSSILIFAILAFIYKDFVFDRAGMWEDVVVGEGNVDLKSFVSALEKLRLILAAKRRSSVASLT